MTTILLLAPFFLGISPVDARFYGLYGKLIDIAKGEPIDTNQPKHDCYYVIESWKKMGKTTNVKSTSATDCCSKIPGVTCTSTGIVTGINWMSQGLKKSIPAELGKLTNLQSL